MVNAAEWKAMIAADIPAVSALSNRIHLNYPEHQSVLQEKFVLFPEGCFTLKHADTAIAGYCFSHPWIEGAPPSLDTLLEALPDNPSSYFIHDLALDPLMQRRNLAGALVPSIVSIARRIPVAHIALVAVNNSESFWSRMGFRRTNDLALQGSTRREYGDCAVHMQRKIT